MNILFTCAGRRVGLVDAFRRVMKEMGVKGNLIATDMTAASAAFHKADAGELSPPTGRVEYVPRLLEIVEKHRIGLIVPLTDLDLRSLARQQERFEEVGCRVMIGTEPSVALCRDKAALNEKMDQAGLASIRTYSLADFRANPFYPCFIKPIRGSAGVGTARIDDEKDLIAHLTAFGELMIVQEYVPGQEYTIDVYRSRDGQVRCVVPRQRLAVRSGEVEKGITVKDDSLIEATIKLSNLIEGLWGVFCCQCRRISPGNPPRFFEVNPRFGGGAPLSIAAGADLPRYLIEEALGRPSSAVLGQFTDRLLMLRYDEAVYVRDDNPSDLPGFHGPSFR